MRRAFASFLLSAALAACTGFHTVLPGIYRDQQPAEDELVHRIDELGIRTVVNLRGDALHGDPSRRAALATDVAFVHVPLSATQLPPPERLLQLWATIEHAERPLLFHCRAGIDRTGLASALTVLHDTGDLAAARGQLALVPYGHLGWFGTGAMDEVLDRYEPSHGKLSFPDWVQQVYAPEFAAAGQAR